MKKLFKVIIVMLSMLVLTGCMTVNMNIQVSFDTLMILKVDMLFQESMLESYGENADEALEEVMEQMIDSGKLKESSISPLEKRIDGEKWLGFAIEEKKLLLINTSIL